MSSRAILALYGAWMLALSVMFYAVPAVHVMIWAMVGASSALAILAGIRRNQPRTPLPWLLFSIAIVLFAAGDTTYNILTDVMLVPNPFPSVADVLYLAMYPLVAAGLIGLARAGAASRERRISVDALILGTGLALMSWIFLISPHALNPELTLAQRLVSIAYPIGDVLILATAARLVIVDRPSPTVVLLTVGSVGLLVADILYGLVRMSGSWAVGGPVDLGWLAFYACWGAAALHPSMTRLTEPRVVRLAEISVPRQILLLLASLLPQAVLLYEVTQGQVRHAGIIAVATAVTGVLVFIRLLGVIASHRRTIARSDSLRVTSAALMSAGDVAMVTGALRDTADRLLPPGTPHQFLMVMNDGTRPDLFTEQLRRGTELRYTRLLPEPERARLGGYELCLICPLVLDGRPHGDPTMGMAMISADEAALGILQAPMEVMVSQAALAIERITLNGKIIRNNNEQYFRTLVHNATDVILIVEPGTYRIRYASPSARQVLGAPDVADSHLLDLLEQDFRPAALRLLTGTDAEPGPHDGDWVVVRPDGARVQVEASCRDLTDEPTVAGIVVTIRDVTAQRQMQAELTRLAFHDPLTGLANRTLFQERLVSAARSAQRTGSVTGVLFIDLDDFKVVNDTLGHSSGDELLRAVAQRLASVLRHHGAAARLGGDEFAALIENAPSAGAVEEVATRIVAALAEPFTVNGHVVSGMASVGIATTADATDGQDLLRQADLALYVAKDAGKGQWRRYQPELHAVIVERLQLRAEMERSLAADDFVLEFQPIVALRGARAVGFEALVRWDHPTRGRLLPGHFIDVAEESGHIVALGRWILTQAVRTAAQWYAASPRTAPYVSVNVSLRQFRSTGFLDSVHAALDSTGLPPANLMIEITESLLMRDDDRVWDDLAALRRRGVRVAIDDFGTGYSSLSYLRQVPLDAVKLDRLFTASIVADPKQAALVDGIVRLARTLGLDVIAEGIESTAESDLLTRLGCPYGQGFLFSRPLTSPDALSMITARREIAPASI